MKIFFLVVVQLIGLIMALPHRGFDRNYFSWDSNFNHHFNHPPPPPHHPHPFRHPHYDPDHFMHHLPNSNTCSSDHSEEMEFDVYKPQVPLAAFNAPKQEEIVTPAMINPTNSLESETQTMPTVKPQNPFLKGTFMLKPDSTAPTGMNTNYPISFTGTPFNELSNLAEGVTSRPVLDSDATAIPTTFIAPTIVNTVPALPLNPTQDSQSIDRNTNVPVPTTLNSLPPNPTEASLAIDLRFNLRH